MIIYCENIAHKIAYRIALIIAKTKVSPNTITIARFLIAAPLSIYFFSRGSYIYNVVGLFAYMSLAIFDLVDGKLARITNKSSLVGQLIDETTDRLLVVIVLGSIFYSQIISSTDMTWVIIVLLFYSIFFFSTVVWYEFDAIFDLELKQYPELANSMRSNDGSIQPLDKFFYNILYVRQNSWIRFCFYISYPLVLGIITNQLFLTFIFIIAMSIFRTSMMIYIIYFVKNGKDTESILIKLLRARMQAHIEKQTKLNHILLESDQQYRKS